MTKVKIPFVMIAHILFIIIVYIFQAMVFTYIPVGGYFPVLLPIAVVGISMFEGSSRGGAFGLLAGILCDASFNQPLIIMTVTLTLVGVFVGILSETIMAHGFPTYIISCFGALILTSLVSMFPLFFFKGIEFAALIRTSLLQTLYSMIFALPLYPVIRALARRVTTK